MKIQYALPVVLVFCVVAALACELPTSLSDVTPGRESIYFNSFESMADTVGWRGSEALQLRDEAPREGGLRSALVSGGCPHPHSAFEFTASGNSRVILRAWGKNLGVGGSITLEDMDAEQQVALFVSEPEWTLYQSEDTLYVQRGQQLKLTMNSGGIVASAMLVDLLEIKEVE